MKGLIIGISGANGTIYGVRLLDVQRDIKGIETYLAVSPAVRRSIVLETTISVAEVEALAEQVYRTSHIAAAISSGSFPATARIVALCSIMTVSGIATSCSDNLLLRAADVILKERRRLVLLVRETPLRLGHLRLLVQVVEMGTVVMPPVPAFCHLPATLEAVIDQTVNRAVDLLDIELERDLFTRWQGPVERPSHNTQTADNRDASALSARECAHSTRSGQPAPGRTTTVE
jgi:4-hydroxy-3-polyprenylbenzoate decarboxylase